MDSRVVTRNALVAAVAELEACSQRLTHVKTSLWTLLKLLDGHCVHPLENRTVLNRVGDLESWVCQLCGEVRDGR
jgi:hypothetical protein